MNWRMKDGSRSSGNTPTECSAECEVVCERRRKKKKKSEEMKMWAKKIISQIFETREEKRSGKGLGKRTE